MTLREWFLTILSGGLAVLLIGASTLYVKSVEENHRMAAVQLETMRNFKISFDVCDDNMRLAIDALKKGTPSAVKRGAVKKIKRTWRTK